ncbi:MAG: hypothetical protein QCI82_00155 [Candidatus Thermoplasmatota archaeon]|nr:hypothetical protein [Candidatus Thermoplasmatota archaeon]
MATRCPKCGRNNYGDTAKCSFCGSSLKFTPGEDIPEIKEEDVQQKIKQVKAKRLRNPVHIATGGILMVIGAMLAVAVFLLFMFLIFSPGDISPSYERGAWHYEVPGGKEMVFGKITAKVTVTETKWPEGSNHGYMNHTAYEIGGNQLDTRADALKEGMVLVEPDAWVYSDIDLGDKGDWVLITVRTEQNSFGESRAVVEKKHGNGLLSGWWLLLPGIILMIIGSVILTIALIGKPDTSLERLMEEDREFRRQQLAMMQAARKAAMEKQKQSTWDQSRYDQALQESGSTQGDISQELAVLEGGEVGSRAVQAKEDGTEDTSSPATEDLSGTAEEAAPVPENTVAESDGSGFNAP